MLFFSAAQSVESFLLPELYKTLYNGAEIAANVLKLSNFIIMAVEKEIVTDVHR